MGAWIETRYIFKKESENKVAPYMGAWIETRQIDKDLNSVQSHPIWVRGLKQTF